MKFITKERAEVWLKISRVYGKKSLCLQGRMYVIEFESVVNWKENESK